MNRQNDFLIELNRGGELSRSWPSWKTDLWANANEEITTKNNKKSESKRPSILEVLTSKHQK